jgi:hypothetical protein
MTATFRLLVSAALLVTFSACGKKESATSAPAPVVKHEHKAPHGGTPVVLGDETYHVELVRDAGAGKLTAYVLDGELEEFIRVKPATFEVVATVGGAKQTLTFRAVANAATGETIGNSSQFEASADWLKTTATFDGTLTSIEIKGTTFAAVAFNFPKGNDKD